MASSEKGFIFRYACASASSDSWPLVGTEAADRYISWIGVVSPVVSLEITGSRSWKSMTTSIGAARPGMNRSHDHLLAGDGLGRRAERLREVERLTAAEAAERAQDEDAP